MTGYVYFYDSVSLLTTLTTLFCKTTQKMHSLVTTLFALIYIKSSFITNYTDYTDILDNMENYYLLLLRIIHSLFIKVDQIIRTNVQ